MPLSFTFISILSSDFFCTDHNCCLLTGFTLLLLSADRIKSIIDQIQNNPPDILRHYAYLFNGRVKIRFKLCVKGFCPLPAGRDRRAAYIHRPEHLYLSILFDRYLYGHAATFPLQCHRHVCRGD